MTTINKKAYIAPNANTYMVDAKQIISASRLNPGDGPVSVEVSDDTYGETFSVRESVFDW